MSYFNDLKKLASERTICVTKCICSHSIVMRESTPKSICAWCGRTVYNKNKLGQKQKFKDELKRAMIREEKKNGIKNK